IRGIKAEISKREELISHNKHAIILSPHKDGGVKEAFHLNLKRKSWGDGDPTPDPEVFSAVGAPIQLKFCQQQIVLQGQL
ncbi:hypothetical protein ACYTX7_10195, partial [Streptococcus pyogenes]